MFLSQPHFTAHVRRGAVPESTEEVGWKLLVHHITCTHWMGGAKAKPSHQANSMVTPGGRRWRRSDRKSQALREEPGAETERRRTVDRRAEGPTEVEKTKTK